MICDLKELPVIQHLRTEGFVVTNTIYNGADPGFSEGRFEYVSAEARQDAISRPFRQKRGFNIESPPPPPRLAIDISHGECGF